MRRLTLLGTMAALTLFIAACEGGGGSSSTPTEPQVSGPMMRITPANCPTAIQTEKLILAVYPVPLRIISSAAWALILVKLAKGDVAGAQAAMFQFWNVTLQKFYAGQLIGGTSATTQANVLALGQALYCTVGLDGSNLALSLGGSDVTQVVFPSTNTQTVTRPDGQAALQIPPGAFGNQPTTIQIALDTTPGDHLNTNLDRYAPLYNFNAVPEPAPGQFIVIAECIPLTVAPPTSGALRIGHNTSSTGFEILPPVDVTTVLNCPTQSSMLDGPGVMDLAMKGEWKHAAERLGSLALDAISPTPLYAGGSGTKGGGTAGKGGGASPISIVDIQTYVDANSSTSQSAPAGSAVPQAPSVKVHTLNGTGLPGASVVFTVTAGGGQLTDGTAGSTVTETSNASGIATVGSWTINTGANTVTANYSFPAPASGDPVLLNGNPVTFNATGTDIIPYLGTGYKYLLGAAGHDAGFQAPGFNDSQWSTGNAAFGSGSVPGTSCPLDVTVATLWNNANPPTDMLLRHTFSLAPWWTSGLTVNVAIDNDIQVFVNGNDVTSTASSGYNSQTDFVTHEGCATLDSFSFTVTPSQLVIGGTNVIAIRARDRGVVAFVDIRVFPTPPVQLQ
ncbi:MAG TPA: hypothetical protein VEI06_02630 [Gemmatimonadaceae bacterium]|nr:hypothetical protein [Gemmatimonadaceae bacterium]